MSELLSLIFERGGQLIHSLEFVEGERLKRSGLRKRISVFGVELGSDVRSAFALQERYEEEMKRDMKKRYDSSPMALHL